MCQHTNLDYHPIIKPGSGKTPCGEWSPIKTAIGRGCPIAIRLPEGSFVEGSLEVKLPTIWTDEKQSREEAERRERLEERRVEEKESEERRCRCAKR
jgi:hypothetical protein